MGDIPLIGSASAAFYLSPLNLADALQECQGGTKPSGEFPIELLLPAGGGFLGLGSRDIATWARGPGGGAYGPDVLLDPFDDGLSRGAGSENGPDARFFQPGDVLLRDDSSSKNRNFHLLLFQEIPG